MHIKKISSPIEHTSFKGDTVATSVNKLKKLFGPPLTEIRDPQEKVQVEYALAAFGDTEKFGFYLYDWKEYRGYGEDEEIEFHIGTQTTAQSHEAKKLLLDLLEH